MNIKLREITIENFKGIRRYHAMFDGNDATITAANGVGKTSVFDAWLWLLFSKDSTGRKEFEIRPLDENKEPIKGLVVKVEAVITVDGLARTLRKEQHEKVVKGQLRGYETVCWLDDVPKKVSDFQEFIDGLCREDTFKLLTDLSYFNTKLHHTERRRVLLELAGEVGQPAGYKELLEACGPNRTVDEYKEVLATEKKKYADERKEIPARIDEIQRNSPFTLNHT
jgi:hypothetical protein